AIEIKEFLCRQRLGPDAFECLAYSHWYRPIAQCKSLSDFFYDYGRNSPSRWRLDSTQSLSEVGRRVKVARRIRQEDILCQLQANKAQPGRRTRGRMTNGPPTFRRYTTAY